MPFDEIWCQLYYCGPEPWVDWPIDCADPGINCYEAPSGGGGDGGEGTPPPTEPATCGTGMINCVVMPDSTKNLLVARRDSAFVFHFHPASNDGWPSVCANARDAVTSFIDSYPDHVHVFSSHNDDTPTTFVRATTVMNLNGDVLGLGFRTGVVETSTLQVLFGVLIHEGYHMTHPGSDLGIELMAQMAESNCGGSL